MQQKQLVKKRAILSVSNKAGLIPLAQALIEHGFELISTGGTMQVLQEALLAVTALSAVTGHPEILGGRVKTLHPAIFSGILARDNEQDWNTIEALHYHRIDMVVVNLYPFVAASKKPGISAAQLIEEIDIGGPSLLRAAAKNYTRVVVCSDPADYQEVIQALPEPARLEQLRLQLAVRTFFRTASYDAQIAETLAAQDKQSLAETDSISFGYQLSYPLRYGENPHQSAAAYSDPLAPYSLLEAAKLQGKALSYNNLLDADAALRLLLDLPAERVVIVKHLTPCGVASAPVLRQAYERAFHCDAKSAFGGIIALSGVVDTELATELAAHFYEVIIAPQITDEAKEILARKKNVRVLELPQWRQLRPARFESRAILGGVVVQTPDYPVPYTLKTVSVKQPSVNEQALMQFAFHVVSAVKSNAIVVACMDADQQFFTVGISGGQTSRVDAVEMALKKAGSRAQGAVLASDAFFPFKDGVEQAAQAGIAAVIQPGGSIKDAEVVETADAHHMVMCLTGVRHFKH